MDDRPSNALYALHECKLRARRVRNVEDDQWLYRCFDDTGELLYVGVTRRHAARFDQHSRERMWWREVATITIEHFPDRQAVHDAEHRAIREENPRHNVAGKPLADLDGLEGVGDFWMDYDHTLRVVAEDLAPFVEPQRVEAALREALPERELARLTEGDGS